jgi:hypothetical protein
MSLELAAALYLWGLALAVTLVVAWLEWRS